MRHFSTSQQNNQIECSLDVKIKWQVISHCITQRSDNRTNSMYYKRSENRTKVYNVSDSPIVYKQTIEKIIGHQINQQSLKFIK